MTSTKGIIIGGVKKIKEITSSEAILELENTPLKIKGNSLALVKTNNEYQHHRTRRRNIWP